MGDKKTFITQKKIGDVYFEGKRIYANSWEEAITVAQAIGVEVVGLIQD